jgi:hypothetical protein
MTSTNDLDNGTGIVKVTNGGTGTSTAPAVGSIPVASSTSAYTPLAIGTSGQVLQSNGTTATWSSSTALATVNLTAQSAAQAATTLYTPASDGLFTITYYAKVTTAATTSSTLGVFSVISTDVDSNVVTTVGQSSQQNSLTAGFISGSITVYAKASTAIQYSLGYASSGATAMQYELHVVVAGTIAPSSTGTVSSFNGRTGAVVPGSSDYTASQVGALASTQYVAGKNFLINGGFDIWQRGTSFGAANYAYTADRWQQYFSATGGTVTQDSTLVPAGSQYAMRFTSSSSAWAWNSYQVIETKNTLPLAGKSVTVSYQAAGNVTGTHVYSLMYYSTAVDASLAGGTWTACTATASSDAVVPASGFASGYNTFTVPSNAQTVYVQLQTASTFNSGQYITVGQIQAEIGSTATAFSRAGGTIQGELAACQRYYQFNQNVYSFNVTSGTAYYQNNALVVQMRAVPTVVFTSVNNNGFPSTPPGLSGSTSYQFGAQQTANATTNGAYNTYSYTASAEL